MIDIVIQIEPDAGSNPWPTSTIRLTRTSTPYIDRANGQPALKQLFQAWFTQWSVGFGADMSNLPLGREVQYGNLRALRLYLGTTTASDIDILDPHTGAGRLLQVLRAHPKITPMPGESRDEFMRAVLRVLDVQSPPQMMLGTGDILNIMFEMTAANDLRNAHFYGQPMDDVFPDYRIPCMVRFKVNTHMTTGIAFSVLDPGGPGRPGRVWRMQALPDPSVLLPFLQIFLRRPNWDGNLVEGGR